MRRWWLGLVFAVAAAVLWPGTVHAQPFSLAQITDTAGPSNLLPAISANGARIVFLSTRDLTPGRPGNADGNTEVFLFDVATGRFTQITNTVGGNIGGSFFAPVINATGTRIAFVFDRNPTPASTGNADANDEIYLFDTTTGLISQITNTTACSNITPSINAAGTRIAFASGCDLTPGQPGNADHNLEIFLVDTTTGQFTQITNTTVGGPLGLGANLSPSISAAGTRIAFLSDRDLTPGNPGNPDFNGEVFLFDTTTGQFTQVTRTTGEPFGRFVQPVISGDGTRIAFLSNLDLVPGNPGNADGNAEVFLFDTTTAQTRQITNTTGGFSAINRLTINATGTRIVFSSDRNLVSGGPGKEVGNTDLFLFDTTTGSFTQVTNTTGGFNSDPSISADGTRIAFVSNRDLTPGRPGNADANFELFVAAPPGVFPQPVPALSEWAQIVLIALLLIVGFSGLARRASTRMAATRPG